MTKTFTPVKLILTCLFILTAFTGFSQIPGFINRQATIAAGRAILDPNGDGYSSLLTSGFTTDDVASSEIPYKTIRSYSVEPYGDLRRGPDHRFSDIVPDGGNNGFYYYCNGTQMQFRFRLGSVMSGSKGYSVLLDTDGKFGASGPNADPNYQPASTGVNGNPGFEIEIVLETNFRIAIYNVDGTSSPVLIKSYSNWQDMSQVSIAGTNDNGDPDFYMDFYIPFSDLQAAPFNLTTSSSLRMSATTVMSPGPSIGGPKSDIYGLNDKLYGDPNKEYEDFINAQPAFTLSGSAPGAMCTAPPSLNTPLGAGLVNISGTWTKSTIATAGSSASITVYKNGTALSTINGVTSGSTFTLNNITLVAGDNITAKAQASGESMCQTSNAVTANTCNPANTSSTSSAAYICNTSRRGFSGTRVSGASVKIYSIAAGGTATLFATDGTITSPSTFNITYSDATHWEYNGLNNSGSADPCSGGPNDIPDGSYYFTNTEAGKCESVPIWGACVNLTATATPVISQSALYDGATSLSGTAVAGSTVRVYQNGIYQASVTATGGNYAFAGLALKLNDIISVMAQASGNCVSSSVTRTVACYTNTPLITADNNNQVTAGAAITGISTDAAGTVIKIYASPSTLIATTTVQNNGTWSTSNAGTTPSLYNALAGSSYYATAQNGTCNLSTNSATYSAANSTSTGRCGTITSPVIASAGSISGTVSGSFTTTTINLYLDGQSIGTTTTTGTSWGPVTVNSTANNTLYSNGILTIGIQETGKQETFCPASATSINCSPSPTSPIVSPASSLITAGQSVTYTISNAVAGTFYAVSDSATGQSLGQGKWATSNGSLSLTTNPYPSSGSYIAQVKGTSLSGVTACTSPSASGSVTVTGTLPISSINLKGNRAGHTIFINWTTEGEYQLSHFEIERSNDGSVFEDVGTSAATGNGTRSTKYSFDDLHPVAGRNFYRIKIVNINGTYSYSNIISFQAENALVINKILPNPFTDKLRLSIFVETATPLTVQLLDCNGKPVITTLTHGHAGLNNLDLTGLGSFSKGVYFIRVTTDRSVNQEKVLKLN